MKSKWFLIGLGIILLLFFVGYLYSKGYIHTNWQWLAAILAALAGPTQFISNLLSGTNKKAESILKRQNNRIEIEKKHRVIYDNAIHQKEQRIQELEAQLASMQQKIDSLELEQQQVADDINNINDVEKLQDEFMQAYGDENE
jgi:TolA-binding protein